MQQDTSRRPRARFVAVAPLAPAVIVVAAAMVLLRGGFGTSPGPSPTATAVASIVETAPPATSTPAPATSPSPTPTPTPPPLPAGLDNKTWVTRNEVEGVGYVAGTLDGRHHLVLPAGEFPLDARAGRVLSVRHGPIAASGLATSSTVIVRDVASGKVIIEVERPGAIAYAVMGGDTAYVTAEYTEVPGEVPAVDAISLADGSVREVIPAQDIGVDPKGQAPWNAAHGGLLTLSPSGRTLGSCIWQNSLCDIETLDLETGVLNRAVAGLAGGLWLLSDEVLVAVVGEADTAGYDAATGKLLWVIEGARAQSGYLLSDGLTLVEAYQDVGTSARIVATVDIRSGARYELLDTPKEELNPSLWAEASNDRYAVLIPGGQGLDVALAGTGSFLADLLDLSTGKIERSALRVSTR